MRILVISDIHNGYFNAYNVIKKHTDIKTVFFLGDGCRYLQTLKDAFPDRKFCAVSGNCDFGEFEYPYTNIEIINDVKIIYTHGHKFGVKYGLYELLSYAKSVGAGLVLYGHTHIADEKYIDGIHIVNPGSVTLGRSGGNSYAIVDITDSGIVTNIIKC